MNGLGTGALATLTVVVMLGVPGTMAECIPTSAPPETLSINLPDSTGVIEYVEERELCVATGTPDESRGEGCGYAVAPPTIPPPHRWGYMFGEGTWEYEEANGIPGLQAGGFAIIPGVCTPVGTPCLWWVEYVQDETCGQGFDRYVGFYVTVPPPNV